MYLTSMDTAVFKLTLNGFVVNNKQEAVANAVVKLDGKEVTANEKGEFTYDQLEVKRWIYRLALLNILQCLQSFR